jgi:hypothetical protein
MQVLDGGIWNIVFKCLGILELTPSKFQMWILINEWIWIIVFKWFEFKKFIPPIDIQAKICVFWTHLEFFNWLLLPICKCEMWFLHVRIWVIYIEVTCNFAIDPFHPYASVKCDFGCIESRVSHLLLSTFGRYSR